MQRRRRRSSVLAVVSEPKRKVLESSSLPETSWRTLPQAQNPNTITMATTATTAIGTAAQLAARAVATGCALWMLAYCLAGGTAAGKAFFGSLILGGDKASAPLCAVTLPILAAGLAAALGAPLAPPSSSELDSVVLVRNTISHHSNRRPWQRMVQRARGILTTPGAGGGGGGDPDYAQWAVWCLVLPCLILAAASVHRHLHGTTHLPPAEAVRTVGNSLGYAAAVALSVPLVPVARRGPLPRLWGGGGDNPAQTVRVHQWTGRCVAGLVAGHAAFHAWRWSSAPNMLGEGAVRMVIPPVQCFFWNNNNGGADFQPTCRNQETKCTCYEFVRNFTGMVAGVALLTISLSSMNVVRRTAYAVFYKIHVVAGPTLLLFVVLHWNRSILFLAGSALYYAACSFPVLWEQRRKERESSGGGGGLRIAAVERIECSRPCVAVTLVASDLALRRYRAGQYVQLKAPAISGLSHPFSINTIPTDPNQLRILFRCVGPFTRRLGEELLNGAACAAAGDDTGRFDRRRFPRLYLDGFFGSPNRLEQVLQHDVVVLVAGGIGITPYLSLLHQLHSIAATHSFLTTKKLVLHWSCRDPDLIAYVKREYWDPLLSDSSSSASLAKLRIHIVIHNTNAEDANAALRLGATGTYCDLEHPREDNNGCEGGKSSTLFIPADRRNGVAFSPSRLGPKSTYRGNLLSFLSFALTVVLGMAGTLYCYFNWQSKTTTLPRLGGPICIVVAGATISLLNYFVSNRMGDESERLEFAKFEPLDPTGYGDDDDDDHAPTECSVELEEVRPSRRHNDSLEVSTGASSPADELPVVQLEERKGRRATVHQFLNGFEVAQRPGLFACGPSALLQDLRDATRERCLMRLRRCATAGEPAIALYEETFEM